MTAKKGSLRRVTPCDDDGILSPFLLITLSLRVILCKDILYQVFRIVAVENQR